MEVQLFVETAERGSISRAADALGLSTSAAGRHLASLEHRLGARLIERNTRRMFLTEVGEEFLQRCRGIRAEMAEAEALASSTNRSPVGTLKVTASVSFCARIIAPVLPEFTARFPGLHLSLTAANRYVDLIDSGVDIAVRTREHESESGLVIRRLGATRRVLAASPDYLERHGVPRTLDDLADHAFLIYTLANHPHELTFSKDGQTRTVKMRGVLESNEGQVICNAGLSGLGIIVQPIYIIHDDIVAGRLVPIVDDWDLAPLTINLAYPNRKYVPSKVRVFIDFMTAHFEAMQYERRWTQRWP
ncbi:LysR family transcriptional regulator [Pararobbsia silviterrae]